MKTELERERGGTWWGRRKKKSWRGRKSQWKKKLEKEEERATV